MEVKMKAGLLAMLCLFGMGFAMDAETVEKKELPLEVRAQFMEAMHTGDYETAVVLHKEYGIGGKKMEHATPEMFELRAGIFEAMVNGDWMEAVQLQDQFREMVKAKLHEILPQHKPKGHFRKWMQDGERPPLEKPPLEAEVAE
jgi:hypothetical protein